MRVTVMGKSKVEVQWVTTAGFCNHLHSQALFQDECLDEIKLMEVLAISKPLCSAPYSVMCRLIADIYLYGIVYVSTSLWIPLYTIRFVQVYLEIGIGTFIRSYR